MKIHKDISMTFNILIKEEDVIFVAHCLELDIVATANDIDQAQRDIVALICAQIDFAFSNNNLDNLYHPAPQEIWTEFFNCKEQMEKIQRGGNMTEKTIECPNDCGGMLVRKSDKNMKFRGVDITFQMECHVCPVCGIEVGSIDQAAATQKAISEAYRKKVNLLTAKEICESREKLSLSQKELAEQMKVGIASIKRWEKGIIQTKSMDNLLRTGFQRRKNDKTGNDLGYGSPCKNRLKNIGQT